MLGLLPIVLRFATWRPEMAKLPTAEQIAAMSPAQRRALYDNALRSERPEAAALSEMVLAAGVTTDAGGLTRDHPIIQRMEEVVRSPEGRSAAKEATREGQPAMAGADPLLVRELGSDYGSFDTTSWAGTLVAEVMDEEGFRQTRKKSMPAGSVAKTAAFFEPR